jgi:hypothetical protein
LDYTITKTSDATDKFDCYHFAVNRQFTTFDVSTVTGTGTIVVDSVYGIEPGRRLFLGPSNFAGNYNAFEEVQVTSVSGTTVYINNPHGGPVPPLNVYNTANTVTTLGDICLFSNQGLAGDASKGTMYILDPITGAVNDKDYNAVYKDIMCAGWPQPYQGNVAIIKYTELMYINLTDFELFYSVRVNNIKSDKVNWSTCHDLEYDATNMYRLQSELPLRNDDGDIVVTSWGSYNYHADPVSRFVDMMWLYTDKGILGNQEQLTIYIKVVDQHGDGVSGKQVTFTKTGDLTGVWGAGFPDGKTTTNTNGEAYITYISGNYPRTSNNVNEDIEFKAVTDGASPSTGSLNVVAKLIVELNAKFVSDGEQNPPGVGLIEQVDNNFISTSTFETVAEFSSVLGAKKVEGNFKMYADQAVVKLKAFESQVEFKKIEEFAAEVQVKQLGAVEDDLQVDKNIISRHLPTGNSDTVDVEQFNFILGLVPQPYSEKNNVNTTIWAHIGPAGYHLDKSTLSFQVREVSYAGDTGYIDYANTPYIDIEEVPNAFGLIGLKITFTPPSYFHNNATVYVKIEIYDQAVPPNYIYYDYWFLVIPDYNEPYVINESPDRNAVDVSLTTNISFDVIDNEVGINIEDLELYVNNRIKDFTYTTLSGFGGSGGGYHITYTNEGIFYYNQPVEVSVRVADTSGQENVLYDMWKFDCIGSTAPYIDKESLSPKPCIRGADSRTTGIYFNVFDGWDGINPDSIKLLVDGELREITKIPIIYRIK